MNLRSFYQSLLRCRLSSLFMKFCYCLPPGLFSLTNRLPTASGQNSRALVTHGQTTSIRVMTPIEIDTNAKRLELDGKNVSTVENLPNLNQCTSLRVLSLSNTSIKDGGLNGFPSLDSLTTVRASQKFVF
jgi:hypothetical protein